jgi:hypothetical protein
MNKGVGAFYSNTTFTSACPSQCGNYIVTGGSLPPGLTVDSSTGAISGFPTSTGVYLFSLQSSIFPVPGGIVFATYQITVSAAAAAVPISPAGLLLMTAGLAGVGVLGIRRLRYQG